MKTVIIDAGQLINYQRHMRAAKQMLIRAIPFTRDNVECYHLMYVEYN